MKDFSWGASAERQGKNMVYGCIGFMAGMFVGIILMCLLQVKRVSHQGEKREQET